MGPDVRGHMIDRYVSFEFKEYRRIFRPTDEAGQLDNIGRRFAWFRRILGRHESELENDNENRRVFPGEWRVGWAMFAKFSEITRYLLSTVLYVSSHILNSEDLTVVLSKVGAGLTVQLLLDTLQQTIEFESSISRKYATPVSSSILCFMIYSSCPIAIRDSQIICASKSCRISFFKTRHIRV